MRKQADKRELENLCSKIQEISANLGEINIMEVCGTHTMAIGKSGLRQILPQNVRLISGPGCPVCVTDDLEIDKFLYLAENEKVIITTFGDLLRVPGTKGNLVNSRANGSKVTVVYSTLDAIKIAQKNPDYEIVFLGVGFETTAPTTAVSILQAHREGIKNYSVYSMHKRVIPAMNALLADPKTRIDGFICPGHVSTIIGAEPYKFISKNHKKPCVLTGFEVIDILEGILMILQQLNDSKANVAIQYKRGINANGNPIALKIIDQVFTVIDCSWRGFGLIPNSGLKIRGEYKAYDTLHKFPMSDGIYRSTEKKSGSKGCSCGDILKGIKTPPECKLFKNKCTPSNPVGPCMVSSEGACAAYYRYEV
jgi:hydrogenase expression/formation protein HypD